MSSIHEIAIRVRPGDLQEFVARSTELGFGFRTSSGEGWSLAVPVEDRLQHGIARLGGDPAVEEVVSLPSPYRLSALGALGRRSPIKVAATGMGGSGGLVVLVRTPTSPEHARSAAACGATIWSVAGHDFRGAAPISAQRLEALRTAAQGAGIALSVACADEEDLERAAEVADMVELEARDMQNFSLLRSAGRLRLPVLLRRARSATAEEFLLAAEYVLAEGNGRVALCEAADPAPAARTCRLELSLVALLRQMTHLPVVVDLRHLHAPTPVTTSQARAAAALGTDGLLLELTEPGMRSGDESGGTGSVRDAARAAGQVAASLGRAAVRAVPDLDIVAARSPSRSRPRSPMEVLQRTDGTLRSVITDAIGREPRLEVLGQERIAPPHPSWLRWILRPQGDLLVRWTSYFDGDRRLSCNLAYADFSRVDPSLLAQLQAEEINLGDILSDESVDKFGFTFGTGADAGEFEEVLRAGHAWRGLHPYVWRRYIAATFGRAGFLVIEALPLRSWQDLLETPEEAQSR